MSVDSMAVLDNKLQVWKCDDYFWALAASREDAHQVYVDSMAEWGGDVMEPPEKYRQLSVDELQRYRFFPNENDDPERSFLQEYLSQIAKDPHTARFFAIGE